MLFADDSFLFFQGTIEEASNIKSLLANYENCSGQSVNFQKSGVYFSANVKHDMKRTISDILGVHNGITNTKYLGLPSLVGRSTKSVFGYLKEKAIKRIQSWQAKHISQAGKSVLIRNVAQAIPSYSMSCFLLPVTLCREIEQMFNNYWWKSGSAANQKGVNWLSWRRMSTAKSKGGLGFRSLYGFNIALLGKHVWHFLHNANTLVSRVFKAKYFPNSNVLKATKGSASSFIWKGIWTAKEEICKGFRWVVGNGRSIVATKDPWLRRKNDCCVEQSSLYEGRNDLVSTLFLPGQKIWNSALVRRQFLEVDANAILATPIPQREVMDKVVWKESNDGRYSAKSGYRFWSNVHFGDGEVPQSKGWSRVWNLMIPHKIKVFIWRFCRNVIPVRRRLSSRGLRVPITCPMCLSDVEHMAHLFYDCEFAKGCWNHVNLCYDWSAVEYAHDWLLEKLNTAMSDELIKICIVLWGIWHWRNKKVWDTRVVSPGFAMDTSFSMLSDWKKARRDHTKQSDAASKTNVKTDSKWQAPTNGTLKVNVDASVFPGAQSFTVGMVLRDQRGDFLAGKCATFNMVDSVFEAEAIGVREALSWINEIQIHQAEIIVETDSSLTAKAITGPGTNLLEVGEVINICKHKISNLVDTSIRFVRKNANRVAHELARFPCLVNSHVCFTSPPTCLLEALSYDRLN